MTELVASASLLQLITISTLAFGILTLGSAAVGFALEAMLGESRRVFALPRAEGQLRWELSATLRFIPMAGVSFALLLWFVPLADESLIDAVITFLVCWAGFEVYYWGLHRLMHEKRFFRFHKLHHDSRVTSPLTGYSMSTAEGVGWLVGLVGVPLVLSFFTPISAPGFFAYHALYQIAGNVIGHANVDFFPRAASRRTGSWISHPITYHSLHHARFNNHYGFGSTVMDRLLGTEWADWPELHERVVSGRPMQKLSERGAAEARS
ncbi:MAG: sterol desaturase family protein [Myxococcota bacterium]|jgi:sterol desaturase/sphingolipid hydroxylase (fatty acid hydroxylase superfamily)|nr:sterol desaturase family protein [Myxococcota bacterium]